MPTAPQSDCPLFVSRQGGCVDKPGVGVGGHRLGCRRTLDADAGELRACAGAARPDGCGTEHGGAARMIKARAGAPARVVSDLQHRVDGGHGTSSCNSDQPESAEKVTVPFLPVFGDRVFQESQASPSSRGPVLCSLQLLPNSRHAASAPRHGSRTHGSCVGHGGDAAGDVNCGFSKSGSENSRV